MPWKKNFDVDEALTAAMKVFWAKGYEATSISDLTEAMGVQRQSLYNALGDKREVFIKALLKYDTEVRQGYLADLEGRGTPLASLRQIFSDTAESAADGPCPGCFLVNTALDHPAHDDEVRLIVTAALDDIRHVFERLIDHGKVRGEIPAEVDPTATASGLLAALMGMRVMSRGAGTPSVLRQMADQALRLLE